MRLTMKTKYRRLSFLDLPDYKVGTDGSVWSRKVEGRHKIKIGEWHRLKPQPTLSGHLQVKLTNFSGKSMLWFVHRLVLFAFVGPCPEGKVCRHFPDRNPANCRLSNIRWGTEKQNARDSKIHGTFASGSRNGRSKLTELQVIWIREDYASGLFTQRELAEIYGVHLATIGRVIRCEFWKGV